VTDEVAPRPAATVILLQRRDRVFATFMVKRHGKSGFMAGAHVFPGGALDDTDRGPIIDRLVGRSRDEAAQALGETDGDLALALHVAAIRETFEEVGVLLADVPSAEVAPARERMRAGTTLTSLIADAGWWLRADALVPYARWVTPAVERRRFDARFFFAIAPPDQEAAHDREEVVAGEWLTPQEALDASVRGAIVLAPPTLRTLEEMSSYADIDALLSYARSRPPPLVRPVFHDSGNGNWALTLPGDPDHPERERVIPGTTRFVLLDGRFQSRDP